MRFFVLACLVAAVSAQVTHTFPRWKPATARAQQENVVNLPHQDNAYLRGAEVQINKVYTFGTELPVNATVDSGVWTNVGDGRMWTLSFHSKGAYSINVFFSCFHIPEGAAIWFYNDNEMQGPYTHENNYETNVFNNWPMAGDHITIEYYAPTEVTEMPILDIGHVVHGYKKGEKACLGSGYCNINSVCDPQYGGKLTNELRAGGMLMNAGGSGYCSGSLINTIGNTGQFFLTAAHCGTSHSNIGFNWRSPDCQRTTCPAITDRASNLAIRVRQTASDFTLVEINEALPASYNLYMAGFSASTVPTTTMRGVHHPSADVQKVAYAYSTAVPSRWTGSGPSTHWRVNKWDEDSTTEPGSSGSPLFDAESRIIGQLHGGSASCQNMNGYDVYGGIFYSWDAGLKQYLDPQNSGQLFTDGRNL